MGGQQRQLPRKPSNISSSFANRGSLESAGRSSFSSIGQLLRVCWHSQSLVWQCQCSWQKLLDGIVRVASKLTGWELPSLESIYITRTQRKVRCITSNQQHPAHHLLQCLPSGRHFRTITTRTSCFKNSFYPKAVQIMPPVPSITTQWYSDWPSASWPLSALSVQAKRFTLLLVTWLVLSHFQFTLI